MTDIEEVQFCDLIQQTNGDVSCKDLIIYIICDTLMYCRPFFQRATPLAWAGSLPARGKIMIIVIPNRLNYCIIFLIHIQFPDVARVCTIQQNLAGRMRLTSRVLKSHALLHVWLLFYCKQETWLTLRQTFNPLNPELNPICYLLALLAHHFLHVSRIRVKSLTLRRLMSYIWSTHS